MYPLVSVDNLIPDDSNPRKADPSRLHLLTLSLSKLGFVLPIVATEEGLVLSGHQRLSVAKNLGLPEVPVDYVGIKDHNVKGLNILFNRATNDFGALDTGKAASGRLSLDDLMEESEGLPNRLRPSQWPVMGMQVRSLEGMAAGRSDDYDKKAIVIAENFIRRGIHIPIVVSESGEVLNGIHRLFAALENGTAEWPVVTVPDGLARFSDNFLNYLSMDFHVDEDFADVLRYSAYRRPQNNRGSVPKAYRFWANGERTLPEKESYSRGYWINFRDLHGDTVLDFGSGLSRVSPFLETKGIRCLDFEPYRIDPESESKKPDVDYSRAKAEEFLDAIADPSLVFDSIFMASVLNSIPFPRDRMAALAIVHALCGFGTTVYGTCRDISDFTYEYSGIRQANYFAFDSEPGVRLGDTMYSPKIQKFHTKNEADKMLHYFWKDRSFWNGGNIFYWRAQAPKRVNPGTLAAALDFEFNLPYSGGRTMGLADKAKSAFSERLGKRIG